MTLWAVMVLSAYLAMGISAASFAGSSLIQSNKKSKQIKIEVRLSPEAAQTWRDEAALAFKLADTDLNAAVETETALA